MRTDHRPNASRTKGKSDLLPEQLLTAAPGSKLHLVIVSRARLQTVLTRKSELREESELIEGDFGSFPKLQHALTTELTLHNHM